MVNCAIVNRPGAVRHGTLPEPMQQYSVIQGIIKQQMEGHVMVIAGVIQMCNAKVMKTTYFTFKMATFCNVVNAVKGVLKK